MWGHDMNFRNLEYFIVTAEVLNFHKAADQLHISQQALSNHIIKLENQLGVSLFKRTPFLTLTYAGERFFSSTKDLLKSRQEIFQEMSDISNCTKGKLTIGISHTRGRALLPEILPIYKSTYPGIELSILEGNSEFLENAMAQDKIDLMIGLLPFKVKDIEIEELTEDGLMMLVPDQLMNGQTADNWKIEAFKDSPFLMVGKNNRFRDKVDEYLSSHHIRPNIILEIENIETLLELCVKGIGITFYEDLFIRKRYQSFWNSAKEKIAVLPLDDIENEVVAIGYHKSNYLTFAAKEFIRIAKYCFQ